MRNTHIFSILLCCPFILSGLLFAVGCRSAQSPSGSTISTAAAPDSCPAGKAIVSLTYDDGLASQLAHALPALDSHQFRGTFFLNDISANPNAWKAAGKTGHELASHTTHHPCTQEFDWVKPESASEVYTQQRLAGELDAQIELLRWLGQKPPFSFAYPCGTTWIGNNHDSYIPLIRERFAAARGVEGAVVTRLKDSMNVGAYFIEGEMQRFIDQTREAIAVNGWVVFGFHGVGGDYLAVSKEDHEGFLTWLSEQRESVTVLPFGEAARCMKREI